MLRWVLLAAVCAAAAAQVPGGDTPCWDEQRRLEAEPPRFGAPYWECDLAGFYAPKQCTGSQCYCVDARGNRYDRYSQHIAHSQNMRCMCAREKADIDASGRIGVLLNCDDQGDYHHTQCTGSSCYCVDKQTGARKDLDAHIGLFLELEQRCARA